MAACPIGGMEGVMVAARQTARGRPVGVHLPMGFHRLPICKMGVGVSACLGLIIIVSETLSSS